MGIYSKLHIFYIVILRGFADSMASGPGDTSIRKIQSTGGGTFTLSLPKQWVLSQHLKTSNSIKIDWRPSGALRLTPLEQEKQSVRTISLDLGHLPDDSLFDHLMGAYIAGADVIRIRHNSQEKRKISQQVRRFLRATRGFELYVEEDKLFELHCLLNTGDMPIMSSLNRMYLQLSSSVRDILSVFEGEDSTFLDDLEERESEVDSLLHLIERQVRLLIDNYSIATKLNMTRIQSLESGNLARSLERMMDHAVLIGKNVHEHSSALGHKENNSSIRKLGEWQNALKELMINIRIRDAKRIEEARTDLKRIQNDLKDLERNLFQSEKKHSWMLVELSVSESIRRLCAYARDFGESLINMNAYKGIRQDIKGVLDYS